eukprot:NODE_1567_length_1111_cov_177.607008.p1 GENE.NODE_1567_length_1111_cov_177.607008~~NODE_1567_length_1111_cov_177.607008.p1  ORF type:complete len:326 (+),score=112.50 NODE_1567_length_1111_cov_177.607008:3-980(+)
MGAPNTTIGRLFRMLRLTRILRIVRTARLFHELRALVGGIAGSIAHLFWCLVFLSLVMFVCGAVLMQLLMDERLHGDGVLDSFINDKFGSMAASMYTLFLSATSGQDWGEVSNELLHAGFVPAMIFMSYVAFVTLCVLNVITGLFVEKVSLCMLRDMDYMHISDTSQRMELIEGITRLFMEADENGNGSIDIHEFKKYLEGSVAQSYLRSRLGIDLDVVELDTLFIFLDHDRNGTISLEEFVDGLAHVSGPARQVDLLRMERCLKHLVDVKHRKQGTGSLTKAHLGKAQPGSGAGAVVGQALCADSGLGIEEVVDPAARGCELHL